MPYRPIEHDHGPYGTWNDKTAKNPWMLFPPILARWRWTVRWGDHGIFPHSLYATPQEAMLRLRDEREAPEPRPQIHIVDRKTGKCFSPPPDVVDEIIDGRCHICKAGPEERCDAGLHS